MAQPQKDDEGWKRMVLRSMPQPAWLSEDTPHGDVVLSSRTRLMRNLRGHRFPHKAETSELRDVMQRVLLAAKDADLALEVHKGLTNAERDFLVGCRLVSPDFEWTLPGRALLLDELRSVSLMVNEEDHVRLQALSAGWSIETSDVLARSCMDALHARVAFAQTSAFGYLSASPYNCGLGRRQSAMFHLIGLAHVKRLPDVMKALGAKGIAVRGLFGESSRAIGAFVQVSVLAGTRQEFAGACEYLLTHEREARKSVSREALEERAMQAQEFAVVSRTLSLADALRVLGWVRWAASAEIGGFAISPRRVDAALTTLEIRSSMVEEQAAQHRAVFLRAALGR